VLGPIVAPGLRLLFVGINPSLRSAEAGHHSPAPATGSTPRCTRRG
jgi:TDG/mug DNA glycosylase family protein